MLLLYGVVIQHRCMIQLIHPADPADPIPPADSFYSPSAYPLPGHTVRK